MHQSLSGRLTDLLGDHEPPCISLYLPTHRHHPDNQQDPIRYRNVLAEIESSLQQKQMSATREVELLLAKFQALARDDRFWNHRTDALAILGSPDTFQVFELQRTVPELLVVADRFHTKPLLRVLQSVDRYQVLALSRHEARLYEGNRSALYPVELTNVPSTITEALGNDLTDQHLSVGAHGGGAPRSVSGGVAGSGAAPAIHAHGDKKDEVDIDRDRFFRFIDRGIWEHHSRPSSLPLMLATLTEHHAPFREVSHNPFLMADGIMKNPEALSLDQLRVEAWQIVEPIYLERLAKQVDDYQVAQSRHLGSDDLARIAEAATAGRVGVLLVEDERQIPGKIDGATGQIEPADLSDVDDVLDDLAELVLRMRGEVVVVPADRMPSNTGAAATYRY